MLNYAEGDGAALVRADGRVVQLPHAFDTVANEGGEQPTVAFSPNGAFVVLNYVDGGGAVLLRVDGSSVALPFPLGITVYQLPAVAFSPSGALGVFNYSEGGGAALVRADGTVVQLPHSFDTGKSSLDIHVAFSPDETLAVFNYSGKDGAALVRADGTIITLPHSLAIDSVENLRVGFSTDSHSLALAYVTGLHELRTVNEIMTTVDLGTNVDSVIFTANSLRAVVFYRDGDVYLVDTRVPVDTTNPSGSFPTSNLLSFICDEPMKSGFWTKEDDADLARALQGAAPQACAASPRP